LPTVLFLLGLYLLLTGRERGSAVAAGLGIVSKLFPIILIPVAFCTIPGIRRRLRYVAVVGAVLALFTLPFLAANPPMVMASVRTAFTRPSWETVWALLDRYYGYGVVAPLAEHLNPASATWVVHGTNLPNSAITLAFGMLFALFFWRFWGANRPRQVLAGAAFVLTLLLLYSRGYSPQYLIWIAPLIAILYPNRQGVYYLAAMGLLNLIELPVYISLFPDQHWLLVVTVVSRTILLLVLGWGFLREALPPRVPALPLRRASSKPTES
jgi:hypothetical protein